MTKNPEQQVCFLWGGKCMTWSFQWNNKSPVVTKGYEYPTKHASIKKDDHWKSIWPQSATDHPTRWWLSNILHVPQQIGKHVLPFLILIKFLMTSWFHEATWWKSQEHCGQCPEFRLVKPVPLHIPVWWILVTQWWPYDAPYLSWWWTDKRLIRKKNIYIYIWSTNV